MNILQFRIIDDDSDTLVCSSKKGKGLYGRIDDRSHSNEIDVVNNESF